MICVFCTRVPYQWKGLNLHVCFACRLARWKRRVGR